MKMLNINFNLSKSSRRSDERRSTLIRKVYDQVLIILIKKPERSHKN